MFFSFVLPSTDNVNYVGVAKSVDFKAFSSLYLSDLYWVLLLLKFSFVKIDFFFLAVLSVGASLCLKKSD